MLQAILTQTPDSVEGFDSLLPIHMQLNKPERAASALSKFAISVAPNNFFGPDGKAPTNRVYGFNANGVATIGPKFVSYISSQPLGMPLFYVNGVITGNPFLVSPNATEVQYVGTQITYDDFLLDIKEPYGRM
jgi:hypothetical protein